MTLKAKIRMMTTAFVIVHRNGHSYNRVFIAALVHVLDVNLKTIAMFFNCKTLL